ncbi:hypothetical protein DL93DRAFT_2079344 [Clavulina sp. PMI_390]|nr:hypothetical protein DL93DRAFT_2079344 [Clavulina sp. PMI_390]
MPFISRNVVFFHNNVAVPLGLNYDWNLVHGRDLEGREIWYATLIIEGQPVAQGYGQKVTWAKDMACREYCISKGFRPPN